MIERSELHTLVDQLVQGDDKTVYDFMKYLIDRQAKEVEYFYKNLTEVKEPIDEARLEKIMKENDFITWEEVKREL